VNLRNERAKNGLPALALRLMNSTVGWRFRIHRGDDQRPNRDRRGSSPFRAS
jgi:hypothetical protein